MQARRCLVTNGAGFVGSWWVRHLRRHGHVVVVADTPAARESADVPVDVSLSVTRLLEMERVLELVDGAETVFHLACDPPWPPGGQEVAAWAVSALRAGLNLIEACARRGKELVLVTAGGEEYLGGAGERAVESVALAWHRERGFPLKLARLYRCIGPKQAPEPRHVVTCLIAQALAGEELVVPGHGGHRRSYVYIEDAVLALDLVWRHGEPGVLYEVASGEEVTGEELVRAILALTRPEEDPGPGSIQGKLAETGSSAADMASIGGAGEELSGQAVQAGRLPGLLRLEALGYRPRYDLRSALRKIVTYMSANRTSLPAIGKGFDALGRNVCSPQM